MRAYCDGTLTGFEVGVPAITMSSSQLAAPEAHDQAKVRLDHQTGSNGHQARVTAAIR